jgi:hypothetical protein
VNRARRRHVIAVFARGCRRHEASAPLAVPCPADPGQDAGELERASVGDQHITERREATFQHMTLFPESTPPRDDAASFASRGTFCAHVPEGGRAGHSPPSSSYTRCASSQRPSVSEPCSKAESTTATTASMVKPVASTIQMSSAIASIGQGPASSGWRRPRAPRAGREGMRDGRRSVRATELGRR